MRLDKFLCDMGLGTRTQVKQQIRKGLVTVDGVTALRPEQKVETDQKICVEEKELSYVEKEYYMLNKPAGCISASSDKNCTTVLDLIKEKKRSDLFPVGRLDKDTEGLLLITNDGNLAHCLLSPRKHVDKTYFARVKGRITKEHVQAFAKGVDIGEAKPSLPAVLKIEKDGEESEVFVTIREGKYHQIKRMFAAVGCQVLFLKRLSMGSLKLDPRLNPGEYRPLTEEELRLLQEETKC